MALDISNLNTTSEPTIVENTFHDTASVPDTNETATSLSVEEIRDPNKISIRISDTKTPIIVLFGPKSCGKTMILIRMVRYLKSIGLSVVPDRNFRPNKDIVYEEMCRNFDQIVNSNDAARSTNRMNFMLVKVLNQGRPICHILEAPGEYYFDKTEPLKPYPVYVQSIINAPNRRLWTIFLDPCRMDPNDSDNSHRMEASDCANYVNRISNLKSMMHPDDASMFVYNKIDLTPFVHGQGNVDVQQSLLDAEQNYPSVFVPFLNTNPISRLWRKYNCGFVPFQTGSYCKTDDNTLAYIQGPNIYPQMLWEEWMNMIKG